MKTFFKILLSVLAGSFIHLSGEAIIFSGNSSNAFIQKSIAKTMSYDGLLDQSFGNLGTTFVTESILGVAGLSSTLTSLAIQHDGKIVAAGYTNDASGNQYFCAMRFLPSGQLDVTFGAECSNSFAPGTVYIQAPICGGSNIDGFYDEAKAVAIQSDGKIVLAGGSYNQNTSTSTFAVARLLPNGELDSSFGKNNPDSVIPGTIFINGSIATGGVVNNDWVSAFALQVDGKIVIAGYSQNVNSGNQYFALARFLPDGQADSSFAAGTSYSLIPGTAYVPIIISGIGTSDQAKGVAISAEGNIVLAGTSGPNFAVAQFLSTGLLDASFGADSSYSNLDGTVYVPGPISGVGDSDSANAVAIQPDGKIVVGGTSHYSFAVARLLSTGLLDITFGTDNLIPGTAFSYVGTFGTAYNSQYVGQALALQNDGKIVLAGYWYAVNTPANTQAFAAGRFTADGYPDSTFGQGNQNYLGEGIVYITTLIATLDAGNDGANAILIQSDNNIILGGISGEPGFFTLARLFNPSTFASYQTAYTSVGAGLNS